MISKYSQFKKSPVYRITLELEEYESEAIQEIEPDFSFEIKSGEGWNIFSDVGYYTVVFIKTIPYPGGMFNKNKWEGFLFINSKDTDTNAEQIIRDFIRIVKRQVEDVVKSFEVLRIP